jgi:hypothetical protein
MSFCFSKSKTGYRTSILPTELPADRNNKDARSLVGFSLGLMRGTSHDGHAAKVALLLVPKVVTTIFERRFFRASCPYKRPDFVGLLR